MTAWIHSVHLRGWCTVTSAHRMVARLIGDGERGWVKYAQDANVHPTYSFLAGWIASAHQGMAAGDPMRRLPEAMIDRRDLSTWEEAYVMLDGLRHSDHGHVAGDTLSAFCTLESNEDWLDDGLRAFTALAMRPRLLTAQIVMHSDGPDETDNWVRELAQEILASVRAIWASANPGEYVREEKP